MARILLIETATEVCSTALAVDGKVVALQEELHSINHAALLTLQIDACTRQAGMPLHTLDAVAVSQGPGSYTALRVGASVAKGICYALGKPLIAVDTLLALAKASATDLPVPAKDQSHFFMPMLDARRQEVWTAVYDFEMNLLAPAQPLILENDLFEIFLRSIIADFHNVRVILSGNGTLKLENVRQSKGTAITAKKNCSAADLATTSEAHFQKLDFQDVAYWEPFYMKLPNITTPTKKI